MAVGILLPRGTPLPAKAHFESTPAFSRFFSDPTLRAYSTVGYEPSSTYNSFFGKSLSTEDAIIAWQAFQKLPLPGDSQPARMISVFSTGGGLNSLDNMIHGGFTSVLLDETLGTAAVLGANALTLTASLEVKFKKPIPTPSKVLCQATIRKREGKKLWVEGSIEDDKGEILATGKALFVTIPGEIKTLEKL